MTFFPVRVVKLEQVLQGSYGCPIPAVVPGHLPISFL